MLLGSVSPLLYNDGRRGPDLALRGSSADNRPRDGSPLSARFEIELPNIRIRLQGRETQPLKAC